MLQSLVHVCLAGISTGMFIWLVASGLTLIFGVLACAEFRSWQLLHAGGLCVLHCSKAHGQQFLAGAYDSALWSWLLVGYAMERFLLRYVYHLELAVPTPADIRDGPGLRRPGQHDLGRRIHRLAQRAGPVRFSLDPGPSVSPCTIFSS